MRELRKVSLSHIVWVCSFVRVLELDKSSLLRPQPVELADKEVMLGMNDRTAGIGKLHAMLFDQPLGMKALGPLAELHTEDVRQVFWLTDAQLLFIEGKPIALHDALGIASADEPSAIVV